MSYSYRCPYQIMREEIINEKTRIPLVNSNPLLRNKLTYWKKKQGDERRRQKTAKKTDESIKKLREKEARKIKSQHCVSKYKVTCSNCGQGFRTKKELANHIAHYKKQKWGNTCYRQYTANYRLDMVSTEKKKKNRDHLSTSSYDSMVNDIETVITMIKERMKELHHKCDKCRNTFSGLALKTMTCRYGHKLCGDCHEGKTKCPFCTMYCKISHATDSDLEQASKIRAASTRFKPESQIQVEPKITYNSTREEHPHYCNICFEVCRDGLFNLDCGGHHAMCLDCTSEIVRQSYGAPSCPFCRRRFTRPTN
jgi:hypothetical protein